MGLIGFHERSVAAGLDAGEAVDRLRRLFPSEPVICLDGSDGWCLALGAIADVTVDSDGHARLTAGGRSTVRRLDGEAFHQLPRLLDSLGCSNYRAYGWISFEAATRLVLPRIELRSDGANVLVRATDERTLGIAAEALWHRPQPTGDDRARSEHLSRLIETIGSHDRAVHRDRVGRALAEIGTGRVAKVVITRRFDLPFRVDPIGTFRRVRRTMSGSRAFLIATEQVQATGVTPEVVLRVDADRNLEAELVAGTRPITGDQNRDAAGADELRTSRKEQFEHAVCLAGTEAALCQVTVPGSLGSVRRSAPCSFGRVQHLGSQLHGTLAADLTAWDALALLFPPLTLTGVPQARAAEVIRELEERPRGLFTGVVVSADADGSFEAAAMLRATFQDADGAWLQAGGGIVPGSDPNQEYDESTAKMIEIAGQLVPETPTR